MINNRKSSDSSAEKFWTFDFFSQNKYHPPGYNHTVIIVNKKTNYHSSSLVSELVGRGQSGLQLDQEMSANWTWFESETAVGFTAVPVLVYIFVLTNNILVLLVFKNMKKLKPQHFFMIGLAFADLITLIPNTMTVITVGHGSILLSERLCQWTGVINTMVVGTTTWIQCGMCIDKCVSIMKPLSHRMFSHNNTWKYIISIIILLDFICPFVICALLMMSNFVKFRFNSHIPACVFVTDKPMFISVFTVFFVGPVIIQAITNSLIMFKICRMHSANRAKVKKAMRTLTLTLTLYFICWVPFVCHVLLKAFSSTNYVPWLIFVAANFLFSNSGLSFIIYYNTLAQFKKTLTTLRERRRNVRQVLPAESCTTRVATTAK